MDPNIARSLRAALDVDKDMFSKFVSNIIEKASKPLSDVIPRANLFTFNTRPPAYLKRVADKLGSAKAIVTLIPKLFLSLQSRSDANIE